MNGGTALVSAAGDAAGRSQPAVPTIARVAANIAQILHGMTFIS